MKKLFIIVALFAVAAATNANPNLPPKGKKSEVVNCGNLMQGRGVVADENGNIFSKEGYEQEKAEFDTLLRDIEEIDKQLQAEREKATIEDAARVEEEVRVILATEHLYKYGY